MLKEKEFWFILNHTTGLGDKKVWEIYKKLKKSNIGFTEFLKLDDRNIIELCQLKTSQIDSVRNTFSKKNEILKKWKRLIELNIRIHFYEDKDYPFNLKKFLKYPPLFIYTYGNYNIQYENKVGIFNSRKISPEGLEIVFKFALGFPESGTSVIYGNSLEPFEIIAYSSKLKNINSIIVINRGIFELITSKSFKEFRVFCKNLGSEIDLTKTLILSFVNPEFGWSVQIEKRRNEILFALADIIFVVEARSNGIIHKNCLKSITGNKKVFVYLPFSKLTETASANIDIAENGAYPVAFDSNYLNASIIFKYKPVNKKKEIIIPPVIDFITEILKIFVYPGIKKVIDPACKEGSFLYSTFDKEISKRNFTLGFEINPEYVSEWWKRDMFDYARLSNFCGLIDNIKLGLESNKFNIVFSNLADRKDKFNENSNSFSEVVNNLINKYNLWKIKNKVDFKISRRVNSEETPLLFKYLDEKTSQRERIEYITERLQFYINEKSKKRLMKHPDSLINMILSTDSEVFYFERLIQLIKDDGTGAAIISPALFSFLTTMEVNKWLAEKIYISDIINTSKHFILFFHGLKNMYIDKSFKPSVYRVSSQKDYYKIIELIKNRVKKRQ
ncbi:hypothetical protein DRQ09_05460 [candidate division KSB1 bacterium]|nr:MAG: hypothetical protein DRQ09_05460 [candidate division KSB1 bacterium]